MSGFNDKNGPQNLDGAKNGATPLLVWLVVLLLYDKLRYKGIWKRHYLSCNLMMLNAYVKVGLEEPFKSISQEGTEREREKL